MQHKTLRSIVRYFHSNFSYLDQNMDLKSPNIHCIQLYNSLYTEGVCLYNEVARVDVMTAKTSLINQLNFLIENLNC